MKERVIIIGTGDTKQFVDWTKDADYWVFNEVASLCERGEPVGVRDWQTGEITNPPYWCKRVDASIQIHAPLFFRAEKNLNDGHHYEWLKTHQGHPVYMQEIYPDVPSSVKFPLDECSAMVKSVHYQNGEAIRYFTSSPADMIALAVYQGYKTIELFGIEMTIDTEYFRQAPGVNFWIGVAAGRGIEVILPDQSLLFRDKLYGYTGEIMIMRDEFEAALQLQEQELEKVKVSTFEMVGATTALLNALMSTKSQSDAERLQMNFIESLKKSQDATFLYGALSGKVIENRRYMAECDEKIKAAGGEKAVQTFLSGEKELT